MNIKFENLEKIDDVLNLLNHIINIQKPQKRWLNIKEASYYLGYSKDHIHKLKNEHFTEGVHYHKKAGRVLFDKYELDNWVMTNPVLIDSQAVASKVLKGLI